MLYCHPRFLIQFTKLRNTHLIEAVVKLKQTTYEKDSKIR